MLPIKTILHPTDFSSFSKGALPLACSLARDYGANLVLLLVRPSVTAVYGEFGAVPPEPPEPVETIKDRMRATLPADFKGHVECHVLDGDAAAEIVAMAQLSRVDLIVIGTHGRSGLSRLLLGSVAEAVVRKAPCSVLTVKQPMAESPSPGSLSARVPTERVAESTDEFVTVYSVISPVEAEVIRNALNAEGIHCDLEGAQQAGVAGVIAFPIKIQVRAGDADRAARMIRRRHKQQTVT